MADMVPNSVPKDGYGGFMGRIAGVPKEFPSGPQGHDEDEKPSPPVKIPGTGNRPF